MSEEVQIRSATREDISLILKFIQELAEFEQLTHEVVATEALLELNVFTNKHAEVIFVHVGEEPAGFALFFHNFSTFLAKPGIYLEDLFVRPKFRGKGLGQQLLSYLAQLAIDRDCGRLEWWVLDWNKQAIEFYRRAGAHAMDEWTVYRVTGDKLNALAQRGLL